MELLEKEAAIDDDKTEEKQAANAKIENFNFFDRVYPLEKKPKSKKK